MVHETPSAAVCATCSTPLATHFCAECGEKRLDHHDLSLKHFFEHAFEAFAHFDSTILRTVRALLTSPGQLTVHWSEGRRKPFMPPVQLFLVCNVFYFLMHSLAPWNTLTTDLDTHMNGTKHSTFATDRVNKKLQERGTDLEHYRLKFDAKSETQAKSLVILMVPLFALTVALVQIGLRRYFVEHLVFSLHFYAFFLVFLSFFTVSFTGIVKVLAAQGVRLSGQSVDNIASVALLTGCATYLFRALRTAYHQSWWITAVKSAVLCWVLVEVIYAYRFALFLVTFRSA